MKSRRLFLLLLLAALLGVGGWYGWRRWTAPQPPTITHDEDDPELAEAIEAARRKIKQSPYSDAAWGRLGMLLRGVNRYRDAEQCFAQAAKLAPNEPRWAYLHGESFLSRDPDAALPSLRRAAELWGRGAGGSPAHVAPWLRLAELLQDRGQLDEAEPYLRRALAADESNPSVHLQLGLLDAAREDWPAARKHLLLAEHSPYTQKRACSQLAAVCLRLKDPKASDEYAARAASLPVDHDWIDPFVAECLLLVVGKTEKMRRVEQLEARGDWRQAVELLREILARSPDARAQVNLGRDLLRIGDLDEAEQVLSEVIKSDREQVQGLYLLGQLALLRAKQAEQKKDSERAKEQYHQAIRQAEAVLGRKADHAQSHVIRGLALRALGERKEGLKALRKAVACGPDLVETQLALGEALAEEGEIAEARKHLEQAVRLAGPEEKRPRRALEKLPSSP
jgi:tetratricopeptide (TPR) repeat protein